MGKNIGKKIGRYIRYQRNKQGKTIAEIAKGAGLTAAYISRLEQGEYDSPTLEALRGISKSLKRGFPG